MKRPRIDQLLAGFGDGDATSMSARIVRDTCRALGFRSDIIAPLDRVSPTLKDDCVPLHEYAPSNHDLCIYHYGISSPSTERFRTVCAKRVIFYHNITPGHFFRGFDDDIANQLDAARSELADILRLADAVWTPSAYNAQDLDGTNVRVFELPFDHQYLDVVADPKLMSKRRASQITWLFVGRVAPNKCVEDLMQAFAWYHRTINRQSRLLIVGSHRSCPRYYTMLRMLASDLDVPNICLTGFASGAGLSAYYAMADIYINTSAHEGYCLPLVEAMYKGVPVISRSVGGVPEAMAGAGIRYQDLSPRELAELAHLLLSDGHLRAEIVAAQQRRVADALNRDLKREVDALLQPLLTSPNLVEPAPKKMQQSVSK